MALGKQENLFLMSVLNWKLYIGFSGKFYKYIEYTLFWGFFQYFFSKNTLIFYCQDEKAMFFLQKHQRNLGGIMGIPQKRSWLRLNKIIRVRQNHWSLTLAEMAFLMFQSPPFL